MKADIRNFAIIAHIDHGKSTLADRLLEITQTVSKSQIGEQFLDQNPVSRKRGITIKLAPVRMNYQGKILNLIDTPGHVDFSYEVSRTLAACEGAILLVDATQGIQAQTVAHYNQAIKENLKIIPVINKIDLPTAKKEEVTKELMEIFSFTREEIIYISAKTGENVENLIKAVIERIPPPRGDIEKPLRALIFDAYYDDHRGVIVYLKIVDGNIKKGEKVSFFQSQISSNASELGYFSPHLTPKESLETGEIGYVITGIKNIHQTQVGDTIYKEDAKVSPLPGYSKPKPMVFFGIYPRSTNELVRLKEALNKYSLNDTSITVSDEYSAFLGSGFRVGFLGLLHADIVRERLKQEEGVDLLLTMPQVLYEKKENGEILEPYMNLTIYVPSNFVGVVMSSCQKRKGSLKDVKYVGQSAILKYEMPFSMLIKGLSFELKSLTSGFASIDYEISDFRQADLLDLEIRINDVSIDVLSELSYRDEAPYKAREKAQKLKEALPRQQFRQVIQALVKGQIVAREEIPPFRKDVLAKMSGGDRTRKDKLLKKQKKGKEKLSETSRINIPQDVLFSMVEK